MNTFGEGLAAGVGAGIGVRLVNALLDSSQARTPSGTAVHSAAFRDTTLLVTRDYYRNGPPWLTLQVWNKGRCYEAGRYSGGLEAEIALLQWTAYLNGGGTVEAWLNHSREV